LKNSSNWPREMALSILSPLIPVTPSEVATLPFRPICS
jgi:hypothetical protein